MFEQEFNFHYLFLHASYLQLKHPITNEIIKIKADLPKDWITVFNLFDWKF